MTRLRWLSLLALPLALAALAAPASAGVASPRIAFVQGIPGRTVDVCVGDKEVRSKLRYGAWVERTTGLGQRTIRFRAAAPGTCTGAVLASKTVTLAGGADLTIVATKVAPKVLVFDNAGLGELLPAIVGSHYAFRHAADLGGVTFKRVFSFSPISPAADPVWSKGQQYLGNGLGVSPTAVIVTRPDSPTIIAGTTTDFGGGDTITRIEWILVGTQEANARLVTLLRKVVTDV